MQIDADEMQTCARRGVRQESLRDHGEVQPGAESEFTYGEQLVALREASREPLRRDEHALDFGGTVWRVIDVAELSGRRLIAVPAQSRRDDAGFDRSHRHRSTRRPGSWIHSLNEPGYS